MKAPTFFEGALVAICASVAGSAVFALLTWVLARIHVLELVITVLCFAYVIYLLARSRERVGRMTVVAVWSIITLVMWLLSLPLPLFVLIHVGMIWLVRSLYFYASVLPALVDLALNGLSLAVGIWAGMHTHSLFLAIWCFFLIQALFITIPSHMRGQSDKRYSGTDGTDPFEQAHRSAEAALRKLSSIH